MTMIVDRSQSDGGQSASVAACVGTGTCHAPAPFCEPPGARGLTLLARAEPALLAHDALNALTVLTGAAHQLESARDHGAPAATLRQIVAERAAQLGWSVHALGARLGADVQRRASVVVLAGCELGRSTTLTAAQEADALRRLQTGTGAVVADLQTVAVLGVEGQETCGVRGRGCTAMGLDTVVVAAAFRPWPHNPS